MNVVELVLGDSVKISYYSISFTSNDNIQNCFLEMCTGGVVCHF